MTENEQLHIDLLVAYAVIEAMIRIHPNKEELRRAMGERFASRQVLDLEQQGLDEPGKQRMKAAMQRFLAEIDA